MAAIARAAATAPVLGRVPGWLLALPMAATSAAVLWAWTPSDDPATAICPYRRLFGVACPGCGMVRAAAQLAKGNGQAAFAYHPLVFVLAAQALVAWSWWALWSRGQARAPSRALIHGWLLANLGLLVAVWSVRAITGTLPV